LIQVNACRSASRGFQKIAHHLGEGPRLIHVGKQG
jgi:hypothetical protein